MYQDVHINVGESATTSEYWAPYSTYYYDNKVQFIILKSELAGVGITKKAKINALSLRVAAQPGRNVANLRIRLKETDEMSLSTWHTDGLSLVHHSPSISRTVLTANTLYRHEFNTEYVYQGGNLLVEITRDDSSYASGGGVYVRTGLSSGRMLTAYKDGGYTYPFDNIPINSTLGSILDVTLSVEEAIFRSRGMYESNPLGVVGSYRLRWLDDRPIGTDIKVYKLPGEVEVLNGDIVDVTGETRFSIVLTTTNIRNTPTLQSLWLEEPSARNNTLLIVMDDLRRFNNVEGPITVAYDATKGNLAGRGGPVDSFCVDFVPEGLRPRPNPYTTEKIVAAPSISMYPIKVNYKYRYADEKITCKPNIVVNFIKVGEINP